MTIDEALKKCEYGLTFTDQEYDQIAEWLEELQMYKSLAPRELVSQKQRNDRNAEYHKGFNDGYDKAIDDFIDTLEYDFGTDDEVVVEMYDLRKVAERLKESKEDED